MESDQFKQLKISQDFQLNEDIVVLQQKTDSSNLTEMLNLNPEIENKLLESKLFSKKTHWAKQITQTYLNVNSQSMTIELHYGPYSIVVDIINLLYDYPAIFSKNHIGSGQFGNIFAFQQNGKSYAVKMIKFDKQNFFTSLRNVFKEFFIALVASVLEVGPQLYHLFDYNIVFLNNYALFGMELCAKFSYSKQKILSNMSDLKDSLHKLHSLHVVHRDIKPQNIVWSHIYQRYVFIDFGLSLIVKQNIGQKTRTAFAGSYSYCSPEMMKCFLLKGESEVELYKNDLHALTKCFKTFQNEMFVNSIAPQKRRRYKSDNFIHSLSSLTKIMHNLYRVINLQKVQISLKQSEQHNLIKTSLFILNNIITKKQWIIPQKMIFDIFSKIKKQLMVKIIAKNFQISKYDQILHNILEKTQVSELNLHFLLNEKYLQSIQQWSCKEKLLTRIFYCLINISTSNQSCKNFYKICTVKMEKIYLALKQPPTSIFLKKVRTVLLFFFEKFQKFKKKTQILYFLSDFLHQIGDHLNVYKVRDFIMQITVDPIQYCLEGLKFHLLDTRFQYDFKIHFHDYLKDVKQRFQNIQQNTKPFIIMSYVLKILQKLKRMNCRNSEDIQCLEDINNLCQEIEDLILSENVFQIFVIFRRIKDRLKMLRDRISRKIRIMKTDNLMIQQEMRTPLPNSFQSRAMIICQSSGSNFWKSSQTIKYYVQLHEEFKEKFATHYNTNEAIKFYFQLTNGYPVAFRSSLEWKMLQFILDEKSNALLIQRLQIEWIHDDYGPKLKCFEQFYFQIMWNLKNLAYLFRQKLGNNWTKQSHERQYFQYFETYLQVVTQNFDRVIQNQIELKRLHLIIRMANLLKIFYFISSETEESIVEEIIRISEQVIKQNQLKFDIYRQNEISYIFMYVIGVIYQKNGFSNPQSIQKLQNIFLQAYNESESLSFLVFVQNCFTSILKINAKRKKHEESFELMQQAILHSRKKWILFDDYSTGGFNLYKASQTFGKITPGPILHQFLLRIIQKSNEKKLNMILTQPQGCLFLSELLFNTHTYIENFQICYYRTFKKLPNMNPHYKNILRYNYYLNFICQGISKKRLKVQILRKFHLLCLIFQTSENIKGLKETIESQFIKYWPSHIQKYIKNKTKRFNNL